MASVLEEKQPRREMQVLAMGLLRTGTASICEALEILGYHDVFHGIKAINNPGDWEILSRAADATFPSLPSYTGKPFTHDDWEELYGPYEATTDMASVFGTSLLEAYPKAKVVLVIRDYESWSKSIDGLLEHLFNKLGDFCVTFIEPLIGSYSGTTARKIMLGFFEARDVGEARRHMKMAYDKHHTKIRQSVPRDQLLTYRMGDGWEPLCEFLGKPVPDKEFPWVNESAALKATIKKTVAKNFRTAFKVILPWLAGVGVVGAGSWLAARRTGLFG